MIRNSHVAYTIAHFWCTHLDPFFTRRSFCKAHELIPQGATVDGLCIHQGQLVDNALPAEADVCHCNAWIRTEPKLSSCRDTRNPRIS